MKDLTFGQYYPSDSVVHRMDARVKILLMILYILLFVALEFFEAIHLPTTYLSRRFSLFRVTSDTP